MNFQKKRKNEFIKSEKGSFYEQLFKFKDTYPYLWFKGNKNVALRVKIKKHSKSVSILTIYVQDHSIKYDQRR